jgi:hypothetical protein
LVGGGAGAQWATLDIQQDVPTNAQMQNATKDAMNAKGVELIQRIRDKLEGWECLAKIYVNHCVQVVILPAKNVMCASR